jgi:hypothetical protein
MSEQISKLTKEDLEKQIGIPEVYKRAIEHAILEMTIPEDPEDKVWPSYFRAEVVSCEVNNVLNDDDELDDHFYVNEAGWFQAGWKAREKTGRNKEIK